MIDIAGGAFLAIAFGALIAWQIVTGEILTRGAPPIRISREDRPVGFWIAIGLQLVFALTVFGIAAYPHLANRK